MQFTLNSSRTMPATACAIAVSLAATLGLAGSALGGEETLHIRTVAVTGTAAPGTEESVNFSVFTTPLNHSIMHPVIDEQGQLGFTARLIGPDVTQFNRNGLWAERNGSLQLIVRSGTHAPGTLGDVNFFGFASDYLPFPPQAAGGRLAFDAELTGPNVSFGNSSGVWKETSAGIVLVARHGDSIASVPGATFGTSTGLGDFNEQGTVLVRGNMHGAGISQINDEAIWIDRIGTLNILVREGDPAPLNGGAGLVFGKGQVGSSTMAFPASMLNGESDVLLRGNLAGQGVDSHNDEALWIERDGQISLVLREGDAAPGAGNGVTFGGNSVSLGIFGLSFNDAGHVAVDIRLGGSIPTTSALFSSHGTSDGSLTLVAMPGDPAPGMGYAFSILSGPVLNDAGKLAFRAAAPDDDTDPFTPPPFAIWSDRTGALASVVHPGDAVSGRESATVIGTSFLVGFNSANQVAFRAGIDDAKSGYADALFLSDASGVNHVVVTTGDAFDALGDGSDIRTVVRIVHGGLSETGELAFRLDFADGSSGHYVAQFGGPVQPCPVDISRNGAVDIDDLLMVINAWSATGGPADLNGDGIVNIDDLLMVVNAWGACP